jgi:hypothetical protein
MDISFFILFLHRVSAPERGLNLRSGDPREKFASLEDQKKLFGGLRTGLIPQPVRQTRRYSE